jgi:hypothetical protein
MLAEAAAEAVEEEMVLEDLEAAEQEEFLQEHQILEAAAEQDLQVDLE